VRRLGFIIGLSLLAPTLAMIPSTTSAAEADVQAAYVKVALSRDGNTYRHPGFLMAMDEEGVFVIKCDDRNHEIAVSFREVGETRFTLYIEYDIDGRTQWAEELEVEAGTDAELEKGRSLLTFNVDPQGSEDTTRDDEDKLDDPGHDEDDPLGGLPLK
jgi:hypothetical protein